MRVLVLADRLSVRGGADLYLLDVVGALSRNGHAVRFGVGRVEPGWSGSVPVDRVRGLSSMVASSARLNGLGALLDWADVVWVQNVMNPIALAQVVATGRAVVTVQDHRIFCPGGGKTLPSGRPCGVQMGEEACTQCVPDGDYLSRTLSLTEARRDAVKGARLVVLSHWMADELGKAGLPGATVIPPWVAARSSPAPVGHGFLLAGRLVPHKGVDLAHQAWEQAGRPEPLFVAGAGSMLDALAGAQPQGWVSRDALRALMVQVRAVLFPARWQEPFGIVGLEALAVGTPVIVSQVGGVDDWSEAGCVRVPSGDPGPMAEAMLRLAADDEEVARLGQAGWAAVQRRFTESSALVALEQALEAAVREPH